MKKILLISDTDLGISDRGCEACDQIIVDNLQCDFCACYTFNQLNHSDLDYDKYIVSNFFDLSPKSKEFLKTKTFCHIAHDFMFLTSRNPGEYDNFLVPKHQLINFDFFSAAQAIFLQSEFQKQIFQVNGVPGNLVSWGGNLWSDEILDKMVELGKKPKNGRAFIIEGSHKGQAESLNVAKNLFLPIDIIGRVPYAQFLEKISDYNVYINFVNIIETFNRVLIECKILNIVPIVNKWSGAIHEELYNYNGEILAEKLKKKRSEIIEMLK